MKFQTTILVMLTCVLFTSSKPAPVSQKPESDPKACTYKLVVDNSGGTHTINQVHIEWPNYSQNFGPVAGNSVAQYETTYNLATSMRYLVKVTIMWAAPAVGPKVRMVTNSDNKLIGSYTSSPTSTTITVPVNGTNGATAIYCQGVTLFVTESI